MKRALLILLFFSCAIFSGNLSAESPLFASDAVIEVSIPVDFKSLCRPREDPECDYVPTDLEYTDSDGSTHTVPVGIKIRGGWRSFAKNCSAPLLWIKFDEAKTAGTLFEGESLLPLTTHCGRGLSLESQQSRSNRSSWEQYLLREYMGYRLYQLFSPMSLRVRLVHISYPKPGKSGHTERNYAFFSEHFNSMAARNNAERLERGQFDYEKLDTHAADVLSLYQFMISNTDWSIVRERNTILLSTADDEQVSIPYDLDMSGLVNAHYAGPAPGLPVETVRDRIYLGFCHPDVDWGALFSEFTAQQNAVLSMADEIPGFDKSSVKSTRRFLEKFFAVLNSEEQSKKKIMDACQAWPPSPTDHTTPIEKLR